MCQKEKTPFSKEVRCRDTESYTDKFDRTLAVIFPPGSPSHQLTAQGHPAVRHRFEA